VAVNSRFNNLPVLGNAYLQKLQGLPLLHVLSFVEGIGLDLTGKNSVSDYRNTPGPKGGFAFESDLTNTLCLPSDACYFLQTSQSDKVVPRGAYLHPVLLQDYICTISSAHRLLVQIVVFGLVLYFTLRNANFSRIMRT